MENPRALDPERGQRDAACARCGREAEWMFLDLEQTRVQVTCPDCGQFEMSRDQFDASEAEIVEPNERE